MANGFFFTLWQWAGIALISTGVLMVSMLGQP